MMNLDRLMELVNKGLSSGKPRRTYMICREYENKDTGEYVKVYNPTPEEKEKYGITEDTLCYKVQVPSAVKFIGICGTVVAPFSILPFEVYDNGWKGIGGQETYLRANGVSLVYVCDSVFAEDRIYDNNVGCYGGSIPIKPKGKVLRTEAWVLSPPGGVSNKIVLFCE